MEPLLLKVVTKVVSFFYVIRFCVFFSLVYETFSKVLSLHHQLLFHNSHDPKKFLIAYTVCALLAILGDLALGLSHLVLKGRNRKRLLLHIVAIHFIIFVPVGGAGVYLVLKERAGTPHYSWEEYYDHLAEHLPTSLINGSSITWKPARLSSDQLDHKLRTLEDVQFNFDCCLSGQKDTDSILVDWDLQELSNCSNPNTTLADGRRWHRLKSCPDRFTGIWRSLLMLSSYSLTIASFLFLLIAPFIYSIFEFDARQERLQSIVLWQKKTRRELEEERKGPEVVEVHCEKRQLIQEVSSL